MWYNIYVNVFFGGTKEMGFIKGIFGDSKYSKILTIGLIIIILIILGLLGYLAYDVYQNYFVDKQAQKAFEDFETNAQNVVYQEDDANAVDTGGIIDPYGNVTSVAETNSNGTKQRAQLGGYDILATIEIPKTGIKYPILSEVSIQSLKLAVAKLYGPDFNTPGNVVIAGHNYRNGSFFGRNKQLKNGDKIYITDEKGQRMEYVIYNIYTTSENDTSYFVRDTKGIAEISLTTCTDDSKARLIIWAKENI